MGEEKNPEESGKGRTKQTAAEKQKEHVGRIERTVVAGILGVVTGTIAFLLVPSGQAEGLNADTMFGFILMLAGIVVQRHVFMALKMDTTKLGKKDWFYQGFMTFAFWFITWTLLLTSTVQ